MSTDQKSKPKFKIGDTVELTGVYYNKGSKNNSGLVIGTFFDPELVKLGATGHGCIVDGLGYYGEGALKLKKSVISTWFTNNIDKITLVIMILNFIMVIISFL